MIEKLVKKINVYHFLDFDTNELVYGFNPHKQIIWHISRYTKNATQLIYLPNKIYSLEKAKGIILRDYMERNK